MNTMSHGEYEAVVSFDEGSGLFHGEVVNLRDVITFQGRSVDELREAMKASVEDYLAFCAERGEAPEKPYSGQFLVRIEPRLHQALARSARRAGLSLNRWVAQALERATSVDGGEAARR